MSNTLSFSSFKSGGNDRLKRIEWILDQLLKDEEVPVEEKIKKINRKFQREERVKKLEAEKRKLIIYTRSLNCIHRIHDNLVPVVLKDNNQCGYCLEKFSSRNSLFTHLRKYEIDTTPGSIRAPNLDVLYEERRRGDCQTCRLQGSRGPMVSVNQELYVEYMPYDRELEE